MLPDEEKKPAQIIVADVMGRGSYQGTSIEGAEEAYSAEGPLKYVLASGQKRYVYKLVGELRQTVVTQTVVKIMPVVHTASLEDC